jgi:signal transduction histidine kinase/CheY-like chemotaxis protein/HPt (histidine-containing phosphotransfer) domain-containing protein
MDGGGQPLADGEQRAAALRERERRRDEQTRLRSLGALAHMLPVLSVIYAAAALLFLITPPFLPSAPHVLICALSSALVLLIWAGMRTEDPRFDTPISLATISIAAGMGLTMFAVSGAISNTTTLAIAVVAAGALLYRFSMYAVMVGVVFVGWVPLAWGSARGELSLGLFHLWAATVVGGLVLWSRRQLMLTLHDEAEEAELMRRLATDQARSLERARDAALASAQAKGQFLANVSHEVRTPLNGILGLLQMVDASALPRPQDDYLVEVHKSARSLLAIVNDLLDLSKIEAGEMRLESVPFDIVSMTEEIAVNYASAAQAKGIELLTEIDPAVPAEVCGDPLRLRQVISNLVNNALKFTKEGEIVIGIRVVDHGAWHVGLEVRVSDTGVGISPDLAESIFRPFSQADASTTREYGGTGLGLPICRQLVELMGGDLQLKSAPGKGSTFFFEARFELEERLSEDLKAVTEALAGMPVLVLESNNRAREALVTRLEAWRMKTTATTSFDGALRELQGEARPHVALIDLRSLGKDWRARTVELNRAATARGSTVVAICAHKHEISELGEAGIGVYVEKPIRRAKIIAALLETLNRGGLPKPLPREDRRTSLPAPPPRELSSNGMRILVAEDNEVNQKVVQAHLHALGYQVHVVPDGLAALAALQGDHGYAAVIMDGQMPRMDGYEATRVQRAREAEAGLRRVPIIALTAHAMTGDRRTAFAAGMDDYLSKPFTQKQLQRALLRWAARPFASDSELGADALDTTITSQLLELEEEEPGFLCDVIDSFFSTAEESIETMRQAIDRGDLKALRAAAHMVCGSSQQLGASRLGATCLRLENVTTARDAVPILAELEDDLEGARDALTGLADRALDAAS